MLNKFNLTVREGEVVALVGSSGGGKSSITKLIKRVYEPKSGSILLDGQPLSSYDNTWLQNNIAAVTQEPVLHDCRSLQPMPSLHHHAHAPLLLAVCGETSPLAP